MPNTYIFADEAGCLAFTRAPNVSRFFIVCTVTMQQTAVEKALMDLRHSLIWKGEALGDYFHASEDKQSVRNVVYSTIRDHDFTVQATIMEKSKANAKLRSGDVSFYQHGFFAHFKYGISPILPDLSETLITTASLGTKKQRHAFEDAIATVLHHTSRTQGRRPDFRPALADPCLQVADYCAWAIQRKWERNDMRSYDLIRDRITYEHDLWNQSSTHYY